MTIVPVAEVAGFLDENHYLGAAKRGFAWQDEYGVAVFGKPTSRSLPSDGSWLELSRWCLLGEKNAGSKQWAQAWRAIVREFADVSTFVSYSDPSVGHTGALYRACNWIWAPTWHRLRPPPSGNGNWGTGPQSVKDRWVFPVRLDCRRVGILAVKDASLVRKGCYQFAEPKRLPRWER